MTKTNTKNETKKGRKSLKKTQSEVIATKVTKAKPKKNYQENIKKPDVPKQKVLRTTVQGDENKITSGQREATPHLHREGLSCAVEVPSTRGSREGEPSPRRLPP